jgi:Methyladenine glycosylase
MLPASTAGGFSVHGKSTASPLFSEGKALKKTSCFAQKSQRLPQGASQPAAPKMRKREPGSGKNSLEFIPDVVVDAGLADYLEVMSRAVFQAGLSWASIGAHWQEYREAFDGFDPHKVARYTEGDVDRLMRTEGVLHSARKLRATISNAAAILEVDRSFGSVRSYLRSFDGYAALAADFKKRFKFMGDMNVWYFLFRVHEPVPRFEHWVNTIPGDHPRMKEMVEKARAAGTSMELK